MGLPSNSLKLVFIDSSSGNPVPPTTDVFGTLTAPSVTSTTVSKTYSVPFVNTPNVLIIPTQNCGNFYLSANANTGFTVTFTTAGTHTFSYLVISND